MFKLFLQVCFLNVLIFDRVFFSVVLKVSLRDTKGDAYARKADEGQVASTEEINSSTTDQHIKWLLLFVAFVAFVAVAALLSFLLN